MSMICDEGLCRAVGIADPQPSMLSWNSAIIIHQKEILNAKLTIKNGIIAKKY